MKRSEALQSNRDLPTGCGASTTINSPKNRPDSIMQKSTRLHTSRIENEQESQTALGKKSVTVENRKKLLSMHAPPSHRQSCIQSELTQLDSSQHQDTIFNKNFEETSRDEHASIHHAEKSI